MKVRFLLYMLLVASMVLLAACQANPTVAPAAIPTAAPTQETVPTATANPTQEPIKVFASLQDYISESFCDNPYMPLRTGTEWALSTVDAVMTLKVTEVTKAATETVALVTRSYDFGERYDQAWRCTADGMYGYDISSYSSKVGLMLPVATISHTGYYLPKADLLVNGYQWDEFSISYTSGYTITTSQHYKVVSTNPVDVLGQQVPGVQVRVTGKMSAVAADGATTDRDLDFTREFGLGVGLVKDDTLVLRKLTMVQ